MYHLQKRDFIVGVIVAVALALLFFLTPLKYLSIVEPTIDDIAAAEFYEQYTKNPDGYIFIDVRSPSAFDEFHADGSVNMPLHTLFDQRRNLPKTGKEIVLICSGGRASGVGYSYLEHFGFLNLKRIEGGVEAWHAAGLPVVFNEEQ